MLEYQYYFWGVFLWQKIGQITQKNKKINDEVIISFKEFCEKYNVYWLGPRESDIDEIKSFFVGSVTIYGSNPDKGGKTISNRGYKQPREKLKGEKEYNPENLLRGNISINNDDDNNSVNHNDMDDKNIGDFMDKKVNAIIEKDPKAKFYVYNQNVYSKLDEEKHINEDLYKNNYICQNEFSFLREMDSKQEFKSIFEDDTSKYDYSKYVLAHDTITKDKLESPDLFIKYKSNDITLIAQEINSSGGEGTHIWNSTSYSNYNDIKNSNSKSDRYTWLTSKSGDTPFLVSEYLKDSISINAHIALFNDAILIFPGSIQLIIEGNDRLLYRGADFITFKKDLPKDIQKDFIDLCAKFVNKYREKFINEVKNKEVTPIFGKNQFLGVFGLDAIVNKGQIKMLECNNRFQSSTNILNKGLKDNGFPFSMQELNYSAYYSNFESIKKEIFDNQGDKYSIEKLEIEDIKDIPAFKIEADIKYSNFIFDKMGYDYGQKHSEYIFNSVFGENKELNHDSYKCILISEGFNGQTKSRKPYSYLYQCVFNTNITSINKDSLLCINENICEPSKDWSEKIVLCDEITMKVSLLMQGVSLLDDINKDYRLATNDAIDIHMNKPSFVHRNFTDFWVNAPVYYDNMNETMKFVWFTPFRLSLVDKEKNVCELTYFDQKINDNVNYLNEDPVAYKTLPDGKKEPKITKNGIPYPDIAFLNGDRLRINLSNKCKYKCAEKGCLFCNMKSSNKEIKIDDVKEVLEEYDKCELLKNSKYGGGIRHYLLGGQSPNEDSNLMFDILSELKNKNKDIYVMILPPVKDESTNLETIIKMKKNKVTQFAYNIEIFNEDCREEYIPGKKEYTVKDYFFALNATNFVIDNYSKDDVRSMLLVGLEQDYTLREGIRNLISNGIQPMLSVFRPLQGTKLQDMIPPRMEYVRDLYMDMEKECNNVGMHLGPKCEYCQNNTLSMPY